MEARTERTLLVTDLDNTLWDWFEAWYRSFSAMLAVLEELSGVPASTLEPEIRKVHQAHGTSEYSWLLNELPSLRTRAEGIDPLIAYDDAIHALHSARKQSTRLYAGVRQTLNQLRAGGVMIVGYTESVAYWTEWRIKHTGLDGVINVLYSSPDHDLPAGVSIEDLRTRPPADYGLAHTGHRHVDRGLVKPNKEVLESILKDCGKHASQAVYVGDSLMKDIAMAQMAGVLDVHAAYGEPHHQPEYALLQRVSHWPDAAVAREQELVKSSEVIPTITLDRDLAQILPVFGLEDVPL